MTTDETADQTTAGQLDVELRGFGYTLDTSTRDGHYDVVRLDGHGGRIAGFAEVAGVRAFLDRLATSDCLWCIHLDHGHVDVDRRTGEVTPWDEGPFFNLHDLHPEEWSDAANDTPRALGLARVSTAHQVCVKSSSRPPYGGLWFKRT